MYLADGAGFLCPQSDCEIAATRVTQLTQAFANALAYKPPAYERAFRREFDFAYRAILARWTKANTGLTRNLPYGPACCDMRTIGEAAVGLATQITAYVDATPMYDVRAPDLDRR